MKKIKINASKPYYVLIGTGLLNEISEHLLNLTSFRDCKVGIVSDSTVDGIYGDALSSSLQNGGYTVKKYVFPPGEHTKSFKCLEQLLENLAADDFTKNDFLLALGGGVVGDLTGFAASIYLRGIPFVQVPTSLLAAADSSVGGKTAINISTGKNMVGSFWQPTLVVYDSATLNTLPAAEISCGMAEIVKSAVIDDPELFRILSEEGDCSNAADIIPVLARAIAVKQRIVEQDERESGLRQVLNFGHTLGHAIESASSYGIPHGQAVAAGMIGAAYGAYRLKWVEDDISGELIDILAKYQMPPEIDLEIDLIVSASMKDKKRSGDSAVVAIAEEIGSVSLKRIDLNQLESFMKESMEVLVDKDIAGGKSDDKN